MTTINRSVRGRSEPHIRYSSNAIVLHWLMFLLVVIVGVLGLLHDSWPKRTQAYWINVHALAGLGLWTLLFIRIAWRRHRPPPALPDSVSPAAGRLAQIVHITLYALLFVIPILGIVTFVYHGRIFEFGLFQIDPGVKPDRNIFHPTEDIHGYLAYALFALAGFHAAVALWHHWVRRDAVLSRMSPFSGDTRR